MAPPGYSTFLPTIINDLGRWSVAQVQLLTVPCYFVGAAAYMTTALASDRLQMRGVFCLVFGAVSVVGYAVLMCDVAPAVHYFACFLVAGGLYVVVGLPLAWVSRPPSSGGRPRALTRDHQLPSNSPRYGKRTTATGLQLSLGNCAGILSAFI